MKTILLLTASLLAASSLVTPLPAQIAAAPAAPVWTLQSGEQLEQLLAPVALYPDPLLAELLPAATVPEEIVQANRDVQQHFGLDVIDQQPWDASVKALARYPDVLQWMDANLSWTTDVGRGFLYQQAEMMDAIQRLRTRALALGNLQSTPQQTVVNYGGTIQIVPANPQVVYVPVYQPTVVYSQRAPRPGLWVSFGLGVTVGSWLNQDCDWQGHQIIHWRHDSPRPHDWWYQRAAERPHVTVINQRVTVVDAHNRPVANAGVWHPRSHEGATSIEHRERRPAVAPSASVVVRPQHVESIHHEPARVPAVVEPARRIVEPSRQPEAHAPTVVHPEARTPVVNRHEPAHVPVVTPPAARAIAVQRVHQQAAHAAAVPPRNARTAAPTRQEVTRAPVVAQAAVRTVESPRRETAHGAAAVKPITRPEVHADQHGKPAAGEPMKQPAREVHRDEHKPLKPS